jgi:hypothetical protein
VANASALAGGGQGNIDNDDDDVSLNKLHQGVSQNLYTFHTDQPKMHKYKNTSMIMRVK